MMSFDDCTCARGTGLGCPEHDPRHGQPEAAADDADAQAWAVGSRTMTELPEEGVYCVETGCAQVATTERLVGVTRDGAIIVELVCDEHRDRQ